MSEPRKDAEQYAHWFETAIAQARTGDREIAVSLVGEFAQLATDPHVFDSVGGIPTALLQYIAACLGDWKKHDFRDAEKSFSVTRAAFRPDETSDQHVDAMRAYLLLMARGRGVVAARVSAAAYSGLTEEQVRHMLAKDKPPKVSWYTSSSIGVIEAAALLCIKPRNRKRALNPRRKIYQRRV